MSAPKKPGAASISAAKHVTALNLALGPVRRRGVFFRRLHATQLALAACMPRLTPTGPSIGTTAYRAKVRLIVAALLGAAAVCATSPALASIQPLSEVELSGVTAQGSSIVEGLDAQAFAADLRAMGLTPFSAPLYEGQTVIKMTIDVEPISVQADLSDVVFRANGMRQDKSLGHIQINDINVTGTTLWIWVDNRTFALTPP